MTQRSVSISAVEAAIQYGCMSRGSYGRSPADIYMLGRRHIQWMVTELSRNDQRLNRSEVARLFEWEGTVAICGTDGQVITVFQNRNYHIRDHWGHPRTRPQTIRQPRVVPRTSHHSRTRR